MKSILHTLFLVSSMALFAQQTYVPDDNFEQALIDLGYDDVLDDYVLTSNIITVVELDVSHKDIYDMTGIEGFESLEYLVSKGNFHYILDVSSNSNLVFLNCNNSQVQELYVNNEIVEIHCESNQIANLDVTNCNALELLYLSGNLLSNLDVSNCLDLKVLSCSDNLISELNLENNLSLEVLGCGSNYLTVINTDNNILLKEFACGYNHVPITSIDVSNNPSLEILFVKDSGVTSLDLSNNTNLISLGCNINQLRELDLTNNPIYFIEAQNNQLEWIDIRNGYNDNMGYFDATNNPDLHCVFVDDTDFLYPNNWHVDDNSVFMESEAECDLAVGDEKIKSLIIYPNPVENIFNVQSDKEIHELILYTAQGQVVKYFETSENFYIGDLHSGVYFLKIISNNSQRIESVIKR